MAENYQNEQHYNFSGGVNQQVSRLLMAENELNVVQNGFLHEIGAVRKVRGYTQKGTTVASGYNILGGIGAIKSDGNRKLIVVADGAASSDAYTFNVITNVWTPHVLSLSVASKAEFEQFLDGFFMVNFNDATRWNNFVQWYTTTNVTSAAKAKYIKQYLSRIYLAYVVSGGTTYPSRVTYSNLPSGSPMTLSWDNTINYFDVATDDGDVIKGLEVNANRLLVFKENSLYRYDTNSLYQVPGCPGTVSQRSVKNIQGHTLYLHSTGIWDYNGDSAALISRKIQDIIEGISTINLDNACAIVDGDHYRIFLNDISNSKTGLEIKNCEVDYDIAKNAYTWRSIEDEPTIYIPYRDDRSNITYNDATITYNNAETTYNGLVSSEPLMYFGTTDGAVYQMEKGLTNNGTPIALSIETKDYYLGYPAYWKLMQRVIVFSDYSGKRLVLQAKPDDGDWITLGRIESPIQSLRFPSGVLCERVRFRLLESSSGEPFSFQGLDIYFSLQGLIR